MEKLIPHKEEKVFLEGPRSRWNDFIFLNKVLFDFIKGLRALHFTGPCVTVFGSARFKEDHVYYHKARAIGAEIAKNGFTVLTGGGPGIMEAANRGAKDVGGKSIGCNIVLTHEQHRNPYLDKWVDIKYFFVRKVLLTKYSQSFVVFPGGFGTMDEFFEALTLIQTDKIAHFPLVIIGKEFYQELFRQIQIMLNAGTIAKKDLELILFTDSIEEAISHINKYTQLHPYQKVKPWKIFGEKNSWIFFFLFSLFFS